MKKNTIYAGIDIGGTKIAGALATAHGKIICRAKSPTPKNASARRIIRIVGDLLQEMRFAVGLRKRDIAAMGLGIPGIIDTARGRIVRTPNMQLSGTQFRSMLTKALRIRCAIGNDVNVGTLGEKWLGAGRKTKDMVALFFGTGVGAGIIIDNTLLTGSHGAAAELGHMIVSNEGPRCTCGNTGCLEAFAGRWAIERDIRQAIKKGKKTILSRYLEKHNDTIKSKILRKALKKGDRLTHKILSQAATHIGIACISIRHIFDPEMIVLGGGVIEACEEYLLPIVKKTVHNDKFFSSLGRFEITASQLGDDAIVLGAVILAKTIPFKQLS